MEYQKLPDSQKKKLADDAKLLRAWRQWHHAQLVEALAGPHSAVMSDLMTRLGRLDLNAGAALLEFLQGVDWDSVDYDTRLVALHETHNAITRLRERCGFPPFDDGREDNVSQIARTIILKPDGCDGLFAESKVITE